jgi:hypothetical protein
MEIATCFAFVNDDQNPNVRGNEVRSQYLEAILCLFASASRWEPSASRVIYVDKRIPAEWFERLQRFDVNVIEVPFRHKQTSEFYHRFGGSLFTLDVMQHLQDYTLLVDPDVLVMRPLGELFDFAQGKLGVIPINYNSGADVNGLTLEEIREIHEELSLLSHNAPSHVGGEFLIMSADVRKRVVPLAQKIWVENILRYKRGQTYFRTEEHVFSAIAQHVPFVDISSFAKRIWTTSRLRTVSPSDHELSLWHLPAEKGRGFSSLHQVIEDDNSWFWQSGNADFVQNCGAVMGMWKRSPWRFVRDQVGAFL